MVLDGIGRCEFICFPHASVSTTEIYLHRDVTELAGSQERLPQVWDDASPVAAG
jgi:hypothetical protein